MTIIEIKPNNCITNDPCAICGERCDPTGIDPFLAGTQSLVCDDCARQEGAGTQLVACRDAQSAVGVCPECGGLTAIHNIGRCHWGTCDTHRTRWLIGSNLFTGRQDETEDEQRHAHDVDPGWGTYRDATQHAAQADADADALDARPLDRQTGRWARARARHHAATMAHRAAQLELDTATSELVTAGAALAERVRLLDPGTRRAA